MESLEHICDNISPTICTNMLIFSKDTFLVLPNRIISANLISSQIIIFVTSNFAPLFQTKRTESETHPIPLSPSHCWLMSAGPIIVVHVCKICFEDSFFCLIKFQKGGKTVYKTVSFAGYVGLITGMKPVSTFKKFISEKKIYFYSRFFLMVLLIQLHVTSITSFVHLNISD